MTGRLPGAWAIGLSVGLAGCATSGAFKNGSVAADLSGKYGYGVEAERTALTRVEANAGVKSGDIAGGRWSAELAGRFRWDQDLEPAEYKTTEIRDLSATWRSTDWLVSLGRQSVVWGKVDAFRVLDLVHAFDYREFILDDPNAVRVPLAMARLERRTPGDGFIQLLVVPEHRRDVLPAIGGRFAPVYSPSTLALDSRAVTEPAPDWREPGDWEYGAKWEQNTANVGYSLNVLSKLATSPSYALSAAGEVHASFPRQQIYGGSVDFPWRQWILRGEAVYSTDVFQPAVVPPAVEYGRYKQLSSALGIENHFGEWLVVAQLLHNQYVGANVPPRLDGTGAQRYQDTATLLVTRSLSQDRTRARLFLVRDLTDSGTWLRASVTHTVRSALEVSLGADYLAGSTKSVFGRIAAEDRVFVQLKLSK